jgi:hypothetical protein
LKHFGVKNMAFATFGRLEHGSLERMRSQHLGD